MFFDFRYHYESGGLKRLVLIPDLDSSGVGQTTCYQTAEMLLKYLKIQIKVFNLSAPVGWYFDHKAIDGFDISDVLSLSSVQQHSYQSKLAVAGVLSVS